MKQLFFSLIFTLLLPMASAGTIRPTSEEAPIVLGSLSTQIFNLELTCDIEEKLIYDSDGYHPIASEKINVCSWSDVVSYFENKFKSEFRAVTPKDKISKNLKSADRLEGRATLQFKVEVITS